MVYMFAHSQVLKIAQMEGLFIEPQTQKIRKHPLLLEEVFGTNVKYDAAQATSMWNSLL